MRRIFYIYLLVAGSIFAGPAIQTVSACPLCKEANETNPALPRAYMYSIIFMLTVPATVLTSFGVGFYLLSRSARKAAAEQATELVANEAHPVDDSTC